MQFKPKTEKELAEEGLFQAGVYPFEIVEAADKTSKKGNDMIELKVRLFGNGTQICTDYLLESMGYKLRNAASTMNLLDAYEEGSLDAEDFVGKSGYAKVIIQKDKNGEYPDRNSISDYLTEAEAEKHNAGKKESEHIKAKSNGFAPGEKPKDEDGDDIPF